MPRLPRVVASKVLHETRWLRMKELRYQDMGSVERSYISVERTTRPATADVDAVLVLPLLRRGADSTAVLVRQYRPPLDNWAIELPAGLIDAGETVEETVTREIKEETGYDVTKFLSIGPPIVTDQGITNGSCRFVVVEVESPTSDNNAPPPQALEATETIQVMHVPMPLLLETLHERHHAHGDAIDARLYSYALGRQLVVEPLSK